MKTITEAQHLIKSITTQANDATGWDRAILRDRVNSLIEDCEGNINYYCFFDSDSMVEKWEQVRDQFEELYCKLISLL